MLIVVKPVEWLEVDHWPEPAHHLRHQEAIAVKSQTWIPGQGYYNWGCMHLGVGGACGREHEQLST